MASAKLVGDDDFNLPATTQTLCERAALAVSTLNSSNSQLVSLEGLARQLLRSESRASSRIEALSLSHRELAEAALEGHASHRADEVWAGVQAMEEATGRSSQTAEFRTDDIRAIHRSLASVRPLDRIAGQLRDQQGWIGGVSPLDAEYVSPPETEIEELLDDLCAFIARDDLSPVVQAAVTHAQFEAIHPFGDGNGRVGRCLIHVVFKRRGLAPNYVPPVSLVFGGNKDAYVAGLEAFRAGNEQLWIEFFARSAALAAREAQAFSDQVAELQEQWRGRLGNIRCDAASLAIIDVLPAHPYLTVRMVEQLLSRSNPAALRGLSQLEACGALKRHPNRRKGDAWEAAELFKLLGRFENRVIAGMKKQ